MINKEQGMASESELRAYAASLGGARGDLHDPAALHRWSQQHPDEFWLACWRHAALKAQGDTAVVRDARGAFFPGLSLNYTENLLAGRGGQ
jgi:hypothetical protein